MVENALPPTYGQDVKDMGGGYQDFLSGESPLGDKVLALLLHGDTLYKQLHHDHMRYLFKMSSTTSAKSKALDVDPRDILLSKEPRNDL